MKIVVLDGSKIKNIDMLHDVLKSKLELPDYYGKNLDALWDCITGFIDLPVTFIWRHFQLSKKTLGEKFVGDLITLFDDAKRELGDQFDYRIVDG